MRIACPSCDTVYEVPATVIGGGKRMRCARCKAEWTPEPEGVTGGEPDGGTERLAERLARVSTVQPVPEPALDEMPTQAEAPVSRPVPRLEIEPGLPRRSPENSSVGAAAAVIISVLLIAGICAAAVIWRAEVVQAWPPAARLFVVLGLR